MSAPVHAVAHHPVSLSWGQAASIWMQYLTGYGALIDIAGLKAGDALVIPAASSSVGLDAIQIANRVGATFRQVIPVITALLSARFRHRPDAERQNLVV
jgi:NADPH:quinone reductase-like Zn-dependent oxidoreductase